MGRAAWFVGLLCFIGTFTVHAHEAPKTPSTQDCDAQVSVGVDLIQHNLQWVGKTVLLDTNILLKNPMAFLNFPGAHVIMTGTVFDEIDSKKGHPKLGVASRYFTREFLKLFHDKESAKEVAIDEHGTKITFDLMSYAEKLRNTSLKQDLPDNHILAAAQHYTETHTRANVILITDDNNMRMKSIAMGIQARSFETAEMKVEADAESEELAEVEITDEQMDAFLEKRELALPEGLNLFPNDFVRLKSPGMPASDGTVARYHFNRDRQNNNKHLKPLPRFETMGLIALPRNIEQEMALDVLLDDNVDAVLLEAKAGTGKTFLALVAADYFIKKRKNQARVNLSKPTAYVGDNDPGALPGSIVQKYEEWMKSYLDNLSKLKHIQSRGKGSGKGSFKSPNPNYAEMMKELPFGYELLPFEFLRGRTLDDSFNVLDEGQNTKPVEAKTFLTRAGERAKMVMMGDTTQMDLNEHQANESNNGLAYVIRNLLKPEMALDKRSRVARVRLFKGERSPFADMAADEL